MGSLQGIRIISVYRVQSSSGPTEGALSEHLDGRIEVCVWGGGGRAGRGKEPPEKCRVLSREQIYCSLPGREWPWLPHHRLLG